MTIAMQPIYTQTLGAGGATSVTFNSIPGNYDDLKVLISARTAYATTASDILFYFNNDASTLYSWSRLFGTGSGTGSSRDGDTITRQYFWGQHLPGSNSTANTFNNLEINIPNYTSGKFKSVMTDATTEHNASGTQMSLIAGLYRSTSPITSITFTLLGQTIVQNSTFTLYGITKG